MGIFQMAAKDVTASAAGFALLEVLVAIVVAAIGLLGLLGLQSKSVQMETESYQRTHALILLEEMVQRIQGNPLQASCLAMSGGHVGTTGAAGYLAPSGLCGTSASLREGVSSWDEMLRGVSETSGGNAVGSMIGARGCVERDGSGTPALYVVAVAWQGLTTQALPPVGGSSSAAVQAAANCGSGLYGDAETGGVSKRRVVWLAVSPAKQN